MNGLAVIVWTYLIGWKLIGGMLIGKVMPNHLISHAQPSNNCQVHWWCHWFFYWCNCFYCTFS